MSIDRRAFHLKHGQPLVPERNKARRKSREAAKREDAEREEWIAQGIDPDTGYASGDPNVAPNMEQLTGRDLQQAHEAMDARLSAGEELAAAYGIGDPGDEYNEGRFGLPSSVLSGERERMEQELAALSRYDVRDMRAQQDEAHEFMDDLWHTYRRDYPEESRDVIAATRAAHGVALRWKAENRLLEPETADDFILEVAVAQMQGGSGGYEHPAYLYEADPPTRTAVFGGADATGGGGKGNETERRGPSFTQDIREQQKRDGYH